MGWYSRLISVEDELQNRGQSILQDETGISVRTWRAYVYRYAAELWDNFDVAPLSQEVIKHYVLASAIYEWAATNLDDSFDLPAFQAYLLGLRQAPSVGNFQGYPDRGAWALANDQSLRAYVCSDRRTSGRPWAALPWENMLPSPSSGGWVPRPEGVYHDYHPDHWPFGSGQLPTGQWVTAADPFFSLIGKVQLSMDCAQNVVAIMREDEFTFPFPALPPQFRRAAAASTPQSSDPLSVWLLALYEFGDHNNEEVRKNLRKIVAAFARPGLVQRLNPINDIEKPRLAFRVFDIPFAEEFHCDVRGLIVLH